MNLKYLFIVVFLISNFTFSQDNNLVGELKKEDILSSEHKKWFDENYDNYKPQPETIEQLKHLFKNNNFNIEVYFGTWCSDSQREIPRLLKLLEKSGFNFNNLKLVGVDRSKIVPNISEKKQEALNITNVPTIIVYQNNKEINRFVEYAQESLEKDLLKIFSKQPYKHSYQY
ncbi:thioredoxin family protein [Mesohalobacter salilacus]|uniref:thioredoxin family protein n=1 Tax=Mesohalobacter salilacus TaxID=2491711 RepID=UPI00403E7538